MLGRVQWATESVLGSGIVARPRQSFSLLPQELRVDSLFDCRPGSLHQALIKREIVDRKQRGTKQFLGLEQVTNVGAAVLARNAWTIYFERRFIPGMA